MKNLTDIDTELFVFLNSFNSSFFDELMYYISKFQTWIPLLLLIIYYILKTYKGKGFYILGGIVIAIILADQSSVELFKNVFQRLRPCHNPEIKDVVHIVRGHCGGKYGFVSSHAANTFAVAVFISSFINIKSYKIGLIIWAAIVSYSRIYLGVHYPGDILGGAVLGVLCGLLSFYIVRFAIKKHNWDDSE